MGTRARRSRGNKERKVEARVQAIHELLRALRGGGERADEEGIRLRLAAVGPDFASERCGRCSAAIRIGGRRAVSSPGEGRLNGPLCSRRCEITLDGAG